MNIKFSLASIVLGELSLVLMVVLAFSIAHILRQKKIIAKMFEKLNATVEESKSTEAFYNKSKAAAVKSSLEDYFSRAIEDASQRFERSTGNAQPTFNNDDPFSGKIAALRHLYLSAEYELYAERGITHAGWGLLERRLGEILKWNNQSTDHLKQKIEDLERQLQERSDRLAKQQESNTELQRTLRDLKRKQGKLESNNTESSAVISHLQHALRRLRNTSREPMDELPGYTSSLDDAYVDGFGGASDAQNNNLKGLLQEIKSSQFSYSPEQRKRIDSQVNKLEVELFKSDNHVNGLKQQLRRAKLQLANYELMLKEKPPVGDLDSMYENIMSRMAPKDVNDPDSIIAEINHLKESNNVQHETMHDLEGEITTLKESINVEDSTDVNKQKEQEINRLERLVKECQGCIEILESEVDSLYFRLQEETAQLERTQLKLPAHENNEGAGGGAESEQPAISDEIELLLQELEKTAVNYQHVYAINNTFLSLVQCNAFDDLVQTLVGFIESFNVQVAFYIDCTAGKKEYIPANKFSEQQRQKLISSDSIEPVVHVEDGTLFVYPNICAMTSSANLSDTPAMLDTNFKMVIEVANERLKYLGGVELENNDVSEFVEKKKSIKNMLNNLNIRYAFQLDENRKTFENFISELRRAYAILELKGPGVVVFDNAINEFEMRMTLLLESGDAIDGEISNLVEQMEAV